MRLISARVKGYGRLVDSGVNLDSKVIAVVGPNESGKTTFLRALAYLDEDRALGAIERSRASDVIDETSVVEVKFILDEEDRRAVQHLDLEALPHTLFASRRAGGGDVVIRTEPPLRKAVSPLKRDLSVLEKTAGRKNLQSLVAADTAFGKPDIEGGRDFRGELEHAISVARGIASGSEQDLDESQLASLIGELADALVTDPKAERLQSALSGARVWLERDDPYHAVSSLLWRRMPDFVLFGDADRTLGSEYAIDEVLRTNPPVALGNVARMAELDLGVVVTAHGNRDFARRETEVDKANSRLRQLFAGAWRQSNISVRLSVDGDFLRVSIIEDGGNVTVFDERSAGLRMFVALVAFLATRDTKIPPILLIDEAENHLHIDAQADLVSMFISQEQAARVIYTTHSPACLPPDLGVGVRAIVPAPGNQQVSEITNSFWSGGAGYSPLMIAMGAAAAAFTPARCVVLAEGVTEMILLPSLLRHATGLDVLPYQVAPGLSEVPRDLFPMLDLEGAKVAYLLDSDAGGESLKSGLMKRGVPGNRIVMLGAPGVENLLSADAYTSVVSALLAECNRGVDVPSLPRLGAHQRGSWATQFSKWAEQHDLVMPSKVAVATRIVEGGTAAASAESSEGLVALHTSLLQALGV